MSVDLIRSNVAETVCDEVGQSIAVRQQGWVQQTIEANNQSSFNRAVILSGAMPDYTGC